MTGADLAYVKGSRDLRLDLLRGAAIVGMVVDHVGGEHSWLYAVTGGDRFYVSAAESFVFLAGVVAGIVYGPRAARMGGKASIKLLRRAGFIYVLTTALTLAAPFVARALDLGWDDLPTRSNALQFVVSVITLHRTYHLMDVLLLYVLLFAVAGLIIVWMVDGHTKAVLACSWAVWALWQTATDYPAPWDIQAMTVFQFAAWQALFVTGIALGIHRQALQARWSVGRTQFWTVAAGVAFAGTVVSYRLRGVNRTFGAVVAGHLLSKADLGIGRLVVFALGAMFAFGLVTLAWELVRPALGWLLLPLGQHSLTAYILHVGVVMAVSKFALIVFGPSDPGPTANTLLQAGGVMAVLGLVHGVLFLRQHPVGFGYAPAVASVRWRGLRPSASKP